MNVSQKTVSYGGVITIKKQKPVNVHDHSNLEK